MAIKEKTEAVEGLNFVAKEKNRHSVDARNSM